MTAAPLTCGHHVSLEAPCLDCADDAGWSNPATSPRLCILRLEGGPFDGQLTQAWYEPAPISKPVRITRTTVPVEAEQFVRVYWYDWTGPGQPAALVSSFEVPRNDAMARRMKAALEASGVIPRDQVPRPQERSR